MLAGLSGPAICLQPGDEHDFDDAEGARLIAAGFAELATAAAPPTPPKAAKPAAPKKTAAKKG